MMGTCGATVASYAKRGAKLWRSITAVFVLRIFSALDAPKHDCLDFWADCRHNRSPARPEELRRKPVQTLSHGAEAARGDDLFIVP